MGGIIRVGCAGWSIPKAYAEAFPGEGTHLARYARSLNAVEINSSFYRSHRPETYARWAGEVPANFAFAVKVPRAVTHIARLVGFEETMADFLCGVAGLGPKLGVLLVQLPPRLGFDPEVAAAFFGWLRARYKGGVACEPRHPSWFGTEAQELFVHYRVARVAADPVPEGCAREPGGWPGLVYFRLHGSPQIYRSAYELAFLDLLAGRLRAYAAGGVEVWCIFDNTAVGAATGNALFLRERC
ncbi:MAG: DUF72 domain-containing protein [Chloroflexia bacterium]